MFDTVSVFDVMEMDNTQKRVASRRALALAHNRVERNLGSFLRGARSEADFEERLSLLQDEFAGYVTASSAEVGHEHPEHIAKALTDHYRLAAKAVEFAETPAEKQEEDEEEKKTSRWSNVKVLSGPVNPMLEQQNPLQQQPQGAPMAPGVPGAPGALQGQMPGAPGQVPGVPLPGMPGAPSDPALQQQPQGGPVAPGAPRRAWVEPLQSYEDRGTFGQSPVAPGQHSIEYQCPQCSGIRFNGTNCPDCGYSPHGQGAAHQQGMGQGLGQGFASVEGKQSAPLGLNPGAGPGSPTDVWGPHDVSQMCPQCGSERYNGMQCPDCGAAPHSVGPPGGIAPMAATNPAEQKDTSPDAVTCPECGGDGKTANSGKCAKCAGKGKVRNFGDSAVDTYGADIKTSAEEQNNTGLDGPEPKMNKSQGPGSMPDVPGDIEEKDIVEPIKATNEGSLSGIGDIKTESLPSEKENAGFQSGGEDSGPHTKTFGDGGQANPVTHETLSATNPLSEILTSEFPPDQVVNEALLSLQ